MCFWIFFQNAGSQLCFRFLLLLLFVCFLFNTAYSEMSHMARNWTLPLKTYAAQHSVLRGTRYGREPDRKPLILIYNTNVQLFEKPGVARNQTTNPKQRPTTLPNVQFSGMPGVARNQSTNPRPHLQHRPTYSSLVCQAWPETRSQTLYHIYNTAQRTVLWDARCGQKPDHKP